MRVNMAKKMCEICGERPATVPDRQRMGRLINRVCSSCHSLRLIGDMKRIMELYEKRRARNNGDNVERNRPAGGLSPEGPVDGPVGLHADGCPHWGNHTSDGRDCVCLYGGCERFERYEKTIRAMVAWLEANQPDVFKRGMWDAINAAAA